MYVDRCFNFRYRDLKITTVDSTHFSEQADIIAFDPRPVSIHVFNLLRDSLLRYWSICFGKAPYHDPSNSASFTSVARSQCASIASRSKIMSGYPGDKSP